MVDFNGRMYLLAALYHMRGSFSNLPQFMKRVGFHFNSLPYDRLSVVNKVKDLYEQYLRVSQPIGDEEALKLMLSQDLRAVLEVLENEQIVQRIDARQNIQEVLYACRDAAIALLRQKRIDFGYPSLQFVDELPQPYTERGYSAFTADEGDSDIYQIEPGIYFPIKRLRPFYSEYILLHEIIHVILGKNSPDLLARGLEEGLAEFIGAMYLSNHILGKELTINLFIYNRYSDQYHRFWELYLDATKQAVLLHRRFGLDSLFSLLDMGREKLKEVEKLCYSMNFDSIKLPKSEVDQNLADISDFLILAFSRNLIVSPLAKYLSYYVQPDRSVDEIFKRASVDKTAGIRALRELEDSVNLATFSDDLGTSANVKVVWTDCDRLSEGTHIRYEIPTNR